MSLNTGTSIIVLSSELPKIIRLSDRIMIMREARIAAILNADQIPEHVIVADARPKSEDLGPAPARQTRS